MTYGIQHCMHLYFSPMPTNVFCRLRIPPSWTWLECNRLLSLGRTWGLVTLSRWCVSVEREICSARRGLKSKFFQFTQTNFTAGIFPFKESSSYYSYWPIRTPIFKRYRFQNLARLLGSLSWTFPWCYTVPPTNAWRILQDENQPALLITFLIPCILLDKSIDAVVLVHGMKCLLLRQEKYTRQSMLV